MVLAPAPPPPLPLFSSTRHHLGRKTVNSIQPLNLPLRRTAVAAVGRNVDTFTESSGYLFELSTSDAESLTDYNISKIASIYWKKPLIVLRRLLQIGNTFGRWFALRYLDSISERSDTMFEVRASQLREILVKLGPVEKAGATVLFEDPGKKGNNVGVVVIPVRLRSLWEFGDLEFASNKLIQAEKRKFLEGRVAVLHLKPRLSCHSFNETGLITSTTSPLPHLPKIPNNLTQKMISPSSSSSYALCLVKINPSLFPQTPTQFHIFNRLSSSPPPISTHQHSNHIPTRRNFFSTSLLTIIISSIPPFLPCNSTSAETEQLLDLERYTDFNEGFTLLRPKSWIKVEKAGATVLFEDPGKKGNNVGVVVTPVRLRSLREFGDLEFVSNKLIQAEKRKESTKDVEIASLMERPSKNADMEVYEFEYKLDSTRGGLKTIFSAAFVASKKLYLLNMAHSDNPEQPLSNHRRMMLEQVLHSFDVVNNLSNV